MSIYEFLHLIANQTRAKLLVHYWSCRCLGHNVKALVKKVGTSQANVSKHLKKLREESNLNL